jgi:D-alanyl-D-alanine carboxypeptidase/D-alanyl-D-alanine-endopeptidase (penicillin-binding protein 4)
MILPRLLLGVALLGAALLGCDVRRHAPPAPVAAGADAVEQPAPADPAPAERDAAADLEAPPDLDPDRELESAAPPAPPTASVGGYSAKDEPSVTAALTSLREWVSKARGRLYATVLDLEVRATRYENRAREPVNPASTMKLLTAAAALELLGPARTFSTELAGSIDTSGHAPLLVLRGGGDPGFDTAALERLLRVARGRGLRSVGDIIVDQSLYGPDYEPPGFEQQPEEWAPFRAPVSALALEANAVALNVAATRAGEPARVWYEPPGLVSSQGQVLTGPANSGDRVGWRLEPTGTPARPVSVLSGSLAEGLGRRRYARRLADPRLAPGYALAALLAEGGVEASGAVLLADGSPEGRGALERANGAPRLSFLPSAPVAHLVRALGKDSDNFTAEMLLVNLSGAGAESAAGREADAPGAPAWTSERGAEALRLWLAAAALPLDGVVVKNGSGLFDTNRVSAELLALVLARLESRPELFAEYLSQLAIYGTDGTLRARGRSHPARLRVRAKTGTLDGTDALAGYILRGGGRRPLVFALIVEGARGGHGAVRAELDRAVLRLADLADAPEVSATPAARGRGAP